MTLSHTIILLTGLIAAQTLLVAAFGSLYGVYTGYMQGRPGPICQVLRWYCGGIVLILLVLSGAAAQLTWFVACNAPPESMPALAVISYALIIAVVPAGVAALTYLMFRDYHA